MVLFDRYPGLGDFFKQWQCHLLGEGDVDVKGVKLKLAVQALYYLAVNIGFFILLGEMHVGW